MSSGAGLLRDATARLETVARSASSWDDKARQSFDSRIYEPLLSTARHGQRAAEQLEREIANALLTLR